MNYILTKLRREDSKKKLRTKKSKNITAHRP
jgi:hypothetical protein